MTFRFSSADYVKLYYFLRLRKPLKVCPLLPNCPYCLCFPRIFFQIALTVFLLF